MTERIRLPVDGMSCASCVAHITRAVGRLPGVESVRVDLASDSATVAFDPAATSLDAIAAAIRGRGYEPQVELAEAVPAGGSRGLVARLFGR